jgi:hypothetical protein
VGDAKSIVPVLRTSQSDSMDSLFDDETRSAVADDSAVSNLRRHCGSVHSKPNESSAKYSFRVSLAHSGFSHTDNPIVLPGVLGLLYNLHNSGLNILYDRQRSYWESDGFQAIERLR